MTMLDCGNENLYRYASVLIPHLANVEFRSDSFWSHIAEQIENQPDIQTNSQVIGLIYSEIKLKIVDSLKNTPKVVSDCELEKESLQGLVDSYGTKILTIVEKETEGKKTLIDSALTKKRYSSLTPTIAITLVLSSALGALAFLGLRK